MPFLPNDWTTKKLWKLIYSLMKMYPSPNKSKCQSKIIFSQQHGAIQLNWLMSKAATYCLPPDPLYRKLKNGWIKLGEYVYRIHPHLWRIWPHWRSSIPYVHWQPHFSSQFGTYAQSLGKTFQMANPNESTNETQWNKPPSLNNAALNPEALPSKKQITPLLQIHLLSKTTIVPCPPRLTAPLLLQWQWQLSMPINYTNKLWKIWKRT